MRRYLLVFACLMLSFPCIAQNPDEPASSDDVILYLRTMHSHDMLQKMMAVQVQNMQQLFHEMLLKEKGTVPADLAEGVWNQSEQRLGETGGSDPGDKRQRAASRQGELNITAWLAVSVGGAAATISPTREPCTELLRVRGPRQRVSSMLEFS